MQKSFPIRWQTFAFFLILLCSIALPGNSGASSVESGVEIRKVSEADQWHLVIFPEPFSTPPVIMLENMAGETSAGRFEVRSVSTSGFEYRFSEVDTQVRATGLLRISYLAAAVGEYQYGGLSWKVSSVTVPTSTPAITFPTAFDSIPVVLVQSNNSADVTLSGVGSSGVDLDLHFGVPTPPASVDLSYIAVEAGSGIVAGRPLVVSKFAHGSAENTHDFLQPCPQPVVFASTQTNAATVPLRSLVKHVDGLGFASVLEEFGGASAPSGTSEEVGYIAIANGHSDGSEGDLKLEMGELDLNQESTAVWYPLEFTERYRNPIVIVSPLSAADLFPAQVRIRNLSPTGCEIQVGEGMGGDGVHDIETCNWMVLESGSYTIGGRRLEAGSLIINDVTTPHRFSREFPSKPLLLGQVASVASPGLSWVKPGIIGDDFMTLSVAGAQGTPPGFELVHYVALEPGKGELTPAAGLKFESKTVLPTSLGASPWRRIKFDETYAAPFFFAHVQDDGDNVSPDARHQHLSDRKVDVFLNEDAADGIARPLGLLIFGDIRDQDGDGMPDVWEEKYSLNPENAADATQNPDEDGLSNLEEYVLGTNPRKADTDDDGVEDHLEAGSELAFDPLDPDSDHDGLRDGVEWDIIRASPSDTFLTQGDVTAQGDFDGDGVSNFAEIQAQTDALDYYDGEEPVLHLAASDGIGSTPPFAPPGTWLHRPILLRVTDQNATPLANAPVHFAVARGEGKILPFSSNPGALAGVKELKLTTDSGGWVRVDWKMGPGAKEVQWLKAFTSVGGKLQQRTIIAYSLNTGIPWDLGAHSHFSAARISTVENGKVMGWSSMGGSVNSPFVGGVANPDFVGPSANSPHAWVQFDGSQYLLSPGGLPSDSSVFFVISPDSTTGLRTPQAPSVTGAHQYSLHGLTNLPNTSTIPGNIASVQSYSSGTQRYLLSGGVPSGTYPHRYLNPGPAPQGVYEYMSFYTHLSMLADGRYNGLGLGQRTRDHLNTTVRFDITNATRKNATHPTQINVYRHRQQSLQEAITRFKGLKDGGPFTWVYIEALGNQNYQGGAFRENLIKFERYYDADPGWDFNSALIGNVAPALSAGTNGIGYFEIQSGYAPQLGNWPSSTFTPSGRVVSFHLPASGTASSVGYDGAVMPTAGLARAGGTITPWTTLGGLGDGTQGYSGRVGEMILISGAPPADHRELVEDRLAAHYRLLTPDRYPIGLPDGRPDWWARFLLGSPPADDADGLDLAAEWSLGTHPGLSDSDGDGIDDIIEVTADTDPLNPDSDEDGFSDGFEVTAGTDPLNPANDLTDTDGNGLAEGLDAVFKMLEWDRFIDSDGDGISDYAERQIIETDPTFTSHAQVRPGDDVDNDGVNNYHESEDGTSLVDDEDYFLPIVMGPRVELGRLGLVGGMGRHSHSELSYPVIAGEKGFTTRLVRNPALLPTGVKSGGYSHHYMRDGSRVRFQFTDPSKRLSVGFRELNFDGIKVGLSPGARPTYALKIINGSLDSEGASLVGFYTLPLEDATPMPAPAFTFSVKSSDLIEMRLELNSTAEYQIVVEKNGSTVTSTPHKLPTGTNPTTIPLVFTVSFEDPGAGIFNARHRRVVESDVDRDSLRDLWEQKIIAEFPALFSSIADVHPEDDADGDDLTNLEEQERYTKGFSNDSDGDGMWDGWEILHQFNPLSPAGSYEQNVDSDGDGLSNLAEFNLRLRFNNPALGLYHGATNPRLRDTDDDGVSDKWESELLDRSPVLKETDWETRDSDRDGMSDRWEIANGFKPSDTSDAYGDEDYDSIPNLLEYRNQTSPRSTWKPFAIDFTGRISERTLIEAQPEIVKGSFEQTGKLFFPAVSPNGDISVTPWSRESGFEIASSLGTTSGVVSFTELKVNRLGLIALTLRRTLAEGDVDELRIFVPGAVAPQIFTQPPGSTLRSLSVTQSGFITLIRVAPPTNHAILQWRNSALTVTPTNASSPILVGVSEPGLVYVRGKGVLKGDAWQLEPQVHQNSWAVSSHGKVLHWDTGGRTPPYARIFDNGSWILGAHSENGYRNTTPTLERSPKTYNFLHRYGIGESYDPSSEFQTFVQMSAPENGALFNGNSSSVVSITGYNSRGDFVGYFNDFAGDPFGPPGDLSLITRSFFGRKYVQGQAPFIGQNLSAAPWWETLENRRFVSLTDLGEILSVRPNEDSSSNIWEVWAPDNDANNDGIADDWLRSVEDEFPEGSSPNWAFSPRLDFRFGLDPLRPDRDGDLLPDAWEIRSGFSPANYDNPNADSDGDGLSDYEEFLNVRDPRSPDLNLDGLTRTVAPARTRPSSPEYSLTGPDTDNDKMPDAFEVAFDLNPFDENDALHDLDRDRVSNLDEFFKGTSPNDAQGWISHAVNSAFLPKVNEFDELLSASSSTSSYRVYRSGSIYREFAPPPTAPSSVVLTEEGLPAVTIPTTAGFAKVWVGGAESFETVPSDQQKILNSLPGGAILLGSREDPVAGVLDVFQNVFRRLDPERLSLQRLSPDFGNSFLTDRFVGPLRNGSYLVTGRPFHHGLITNPDNGGREFHVSESLYFKTRFFKLGDWIDLSETDDGRHFWGADVNLRGDVLGIAVSSVAYHEWEPLIDERVHISGEIVIWRNGEWVYTGLPSLHYTTIHKENGLEGESGGLSFEPFWLDLADDGSFTTLIASLPPSFGGASTVRPSFVDGHFLDSSPERAKFATELIRWEDDEIESLANYPAHDDAITLPSSDPSWALRYVLWPKFIGNEAGDIVETQRQNALGMVDTTRFFRRNSTDDPEKVQANSLRVTRDGGLLFSDKFTFWQVPDADGDGMSDDWERFHDLLPYGKSDASLDPDTDGLSNFQEYRLGTDPHDDDTDGDEMGDGWEFRFGFDPRVVENSDSDLDGDGYDLIEESLVGSDPFDRVNDRDGDGMDDRYEYLHLLNPDDGSDGSLDNDHDGLSNRYESEIGTSSNIRDSDTDGVIDSLEVWGFPTDPTEDEDFVDYGGSVTLSAGGVMSFDLVIPNTMGRDVTALLELGTVVFEGDGPTPDTTGWFEITPPQPAAAWDDFTVRVTLRPGAHYRGGTFRLPFALREALGRASLEEPGTRDDFIVSSFIELKLEPEITVSLSGDFSSVAERAALPLTANLVVPSGLVASELEIYFNEHLVTEKVGSIENPLTTSEALSALTLYRLGESFDITARAYDSTGRSGPLSSPLTVTVNSIADSLDLDALPDHWELALIALVPDDEFTQISQILENDDFDGDGLTNLEEYLAGTHPGEPDTDRNGIFDGWEGKLDLVYTGADVESFEKDSADVFTGWASSGLQETTLAPVGTPAVVTPGFMSGADGLRLGGDSGATTAPFAAPLGGANSWSVIGVFEPEADFFDPAVTASRVLLEIPGFVRISGAAGLIHLTEFHPDATDPAPVASAIAYPAPAQREAWGVALIRDQADPSSLFVRIGPVSDWPTRAISLTLPLPARTRALDTLTLGARTVPASGETGDGMASLHGAWIVDDSVFSSEHLDHYFTTVAPLWLPGELESPKVEITIPAQRARYASPAVIHLAATVTEAGSPVQQVAFYEGDTLLGVDTRAPFEGFWRVRRTNTYHVTAHATAANGTTAISEPRVILVRDSPTGGNSAPDFRPGFTLAGSAQISPINTLIRPGGSGPGGSGPGGSGPGGSGPGGSGPGGSGPGGSGPGGSGPQNAPEEIDEDFDGDGVTDPKDWVDYDPRIKDWDRTGVPKFAVIQTGEFTPWRSNKFGMVLGYVGAEPTVDSEWFVWYQGEWSENKIDLEDPALDLEDATLSGIPTISQTHPVVYGAASGKRQVGCSDADPRRISHAYLFTPETKFIPFQEAAPGGDEAGVSVWITETGFRGSLTAVETKQVDGNCTSVPRYGTATWSFEGVISQPAWEELDDPEDEDEQEGKDEDPDEDECDPHKIPEDPPLPNDNYSGAPRKSEIGRVVATTYLRKCTESSSGTSNLGAYKAAYRAAAADYNALVDAWEPGDPCPKANLPRPPDNGSPYFPKNGTYEFNSKIQPAVTDPEVDSVSMALRDPVVYETSPALVAVTRGSWKQGANRQNSSCRRQNGIFTRNSRVLWLTHESNELVELKDGADGTTVDIGEFNVGRTFTVGQFGLGGLWADGEVHKWEKLTGGKTISHWNSYMGREGLSCAKSGSQGAILVPIEFEFVELLENGGVGAVVQPKLNFPSPVIEVSQFTAQGTTVEEDANGGRVIKTTLNISGTIDDALADITPGDAGKVLDHLLVIINENGEDEHKIEIDHQKAGTGQLGWKQFDYTGNFSGPVEVSVTEGINTIKLVAVGRTGMEGYSLHTLEVESSGPLGGGESGTVSLSLGAALSTSETDTVTITLDDGNSVDAIETGENSLAFSGALPTGGALEATITQASYSSWLSGQSAFISAVITGPGGSVALQMDETAPNSLEFLGTFETGGNSSGGTVNVKNPEFVKRSEPGPFQPVLMRLKNSKILPFHKESSQPGTASMGKISVTLPKAAEMPTGSEAAWGEEKQVELSLVEYTGAGASPGQLFLSDESKTKPAALVPTRALWGDTYRNSASLSKKLDDINTNLKPKSFMAGFSQSILYEGVDFVGAGLRYIEWSNQKGLNYIDLAFTGEDGEAYEEIKSDVSEVLNTAVDAFKLGSSAYTMGWKAQLDLGRLAHALIIGDEETARELGGRFEHAYSVAAEVLAYAAEEVQNLEPGEQGIVMGSVVFEILTIVIPASKAKHATKIDALEKLKAGRFAKSGPGAQVFAKLVEFASGLLNTKMCFIAGTLVLTADGATPIEAVRPGMEVWARDEFTKAEGWRPVVQTFTTHPEELFTIGYDTNGDAAADEELTGTGEHPFWVEDLGAFLPMRDLRPGMRLSLASEGATAIVTGNVLKRGPPREQFTTYNFEVAEFHTYFVGESGVWVHNTGKSPCEEVFSAFYALTDKASATFYGKPWGAFDDVARTMGKDRNSSIFGWAADEVMRKQLKDLPLSQRVAEWPSHTQVKATMGRVRGSRSEVDLGGTNFGEIAVPDWVKQERVDLGSVKSFTLESHHGVPKKVQDWLGLTKDKDSVPAYLTTMLEHRGAGVGIHQKLAQKMGDKIGSGAVNLNQAKPAALTNDLIKEALQETYEEFGLGHFWEVCEHWIGTP